MEPKCMYYVEHFELVSMKDYKFSYKFKEACRADAEKFCQGQGDKHAIIRCLSQKVFEAKVLGKGELLNAACRSQLKVFFFPK